jgi:hypothetical protein
MILAQQFRDIVSETDVVKDQTADVKSPFMLYHQVAFVR